MTSTSFIDDLRLAWRGAWAHRSGFGMAAAVLACGLGLALAMACVLDAVLLRQLPLPNAERLLQVREVTAQGGLINLATPNWQDLDAAVPAFAATAIHASGDAHLSQGGRARRAGVSYVGGDFFAVVGQAPALGRGLAAQDPGTGAVISHALWQDLLQGRDDVLGSGLDLDGRDYTIVGVMPPGFGFPANSDAWVAIDPAWLGSSRSAHNWQMLALLAPGSSLAQAQQQADALARRLVAAHGQDMTARGFDVAPLAQVMAAPVRGALSVLAGGVGLLLLIAVGNAINLLLSVAVGRRRERAIHAALGADRGRLLRQALAEHLVLAGVAWLAGVAVALAALRGLLALAGDSLPRAAEVALTPGLLLASALLMLAIALVLTLATSWRRAAHPVTAALRDGGRGQSPGRATLRARTGLMVLQTALSTCLLVAAVLVGRSFLALLAVDPGFAAHGAVHIQLSQPDSGSRDGQQATARRYLALIRELSALPGVQAVGGSNRLPLSHGANGAFWDHTVTGLDARPPAPLGHAEFSTVSPGWFQAAGIPLLTGRDFSDADQADGRHVAVVSRQVAVAVWGSPERALGQRIQAGNMDGDPRLLTVVGVVGDVHERRLDRAPAGMVYRHLGQRPAGSGQFHVVVRAPLPLATLMPMLRQHLEPRAGQMPYSLQPLSGLRAQSLAQRRFNLVLLAVFAGSALLLAGAGLYGLMAFSVGQRGGEYALRRALGATATGIGRTVLARGLAIVATGIVLGLALAAAAARLLASLLHGVPPGDPLSHAVVAATLLAVAVLACLVPARRAARIAPAAVLQ